MPGARLAKSGNPRALLIVWLALMLATSAVAATPNFPALTGRVVDDAGVLSASTQSDLSETLARHEQATGEQVLVVTLPSLQGLAIEDFGYQLGRAWGIGQKGKNTGAILIVAPNDHKVRIEVGYGLEGKLTDAQSRVIIERDILPAFRRGDFDAGVTAGTASLLTVLCADVASPATTQRDATWRPPGSSSLLSPLLIFGIYGLFYLFWMLRARRYRGAPGAGVWRSSAADPMGIGMIGNRYPRGPFFGGGFGGGGFGGGGGGFSGGGGSFGGGGASGGW